LIDRQGRRSAIQPKLTSPSVGFRPIPAIRLIANSYAQCSWSILRDFHVNFTGPLTPSRHLRPRL
jgi:hypothetical protein